MGVIKKLSAVVFTAFLFTSSVYGKADAEKKTYVNLDQIVVTEKGVFAYLGKGEKPIAGRNLSFDEKGMYIKEWKGPCWLHDPWCPQCGGCGILFCPMNCSCFD